MTAFSVDTFCDRCARPIRSRNHIATLCTLAINTLRNRIER